MEKQSFSRRRFIGTGMLAAAGMALASKSSFANAVFAKTKPNSKFNGVQIGVITYSYRSMPGSIQQILQYCIDSDINAVELMGDAAEAYAGAPKRDGSDDYNAKLANWRENTIMDGFFAIRKMFNEAGINIYAWKPNALGVKNNATIGRYCRKAQYDGGLPCAHTGYPYFVGHCFKSVGAQWYKFRYWPLHCRDQHQSS